MLFPRFDLQEAKPALSGAKLHKIAKAPAGALAC